MKHFITAIFLSAICFTVKGQSVAQIKKALDTAGNPVSYVKFKLKKRFFIDTVAVLSSTSFMGLPDSIAYKGKVNKVYGPFKNANILIKILAKLPNTFYHVSHIVIDTAVFKKEFADSLAGSIIKKIQSGAASFESMAATYSSDHVSAVKGGDLGWFVRGVMLPQLDKAIGTHKKGELFKVWTPSGLHVVTIRDNPKEDDGFALMLRVIL